MSKLILISAINCFIFLSCGFSKTILKEDIGSNQSLYAVILEEKREKNALSIYLLNNTSKEVAVYYFYKHFCDSIEKRLSGPIIKKQKRYYARFQFSVDNKYDGTLTSNDTHILNRARQILDSLNWCMTSDFNSYKGLKLIKEVTK